MSNFPSRTAKNRVDFKDEEEESEDIYSSSGSSEDETESSSSDDDVPLRLICDDCLNFFMEIRQGHRLKSAGTQTADAAAPKDIHSKRIFVEAATQTDNFAEEEEDSVSYRLSLSTSDDEEDSLNGEGGEEDTGSYQMSLSSSDDEEEEEENGGAADIQNNSGGSGNLGKRRFESNGADEQQGTSNSGSAKRPKISSLQSTGGTMQLRRSKRINDQSEFQNKATSSSAEKIARATSPQQNGRREQAGGFKAKKTGKISEKAKIEIARPQRAGLFWMEEVRRLDPQKYTGKSQTEMWKEWLKVEDRYKWDKLAADDKKRYAESRKKANFCPVRPITAYTYWRSENYRRIVTAHPGLSRQEKMLIAGEEWRAVKNKSKWIHLAAKNKDRFEKERAAFEQKKKLKKNSK